MTTLAQSHAYARFEKKYTSSALSVIDEEGVFEGYASVFQREDLGKDIVLPGAFGESLKARPPSSVRMLYQHDPLEPIGVWQDIREDGQGLLVRGKLSLSVPRARDIHSLMRDGAIDGLSIGFTPLGGKRDRKTGIRRLEKIDLWEISVVTFPMLPEARVHDVKAARLMSEREFERWLMREAGLSRSASRVVIARGYRALCAEMAHTPTGRAARDAGGLKTGDRTRLISGLKSAARLMNSYTKSQRR